MLEFFNTNVDTLTPQSDRAEKLVLMAAKEVPILDEARRIERSLKAKKSPKLAIIYNARAAPNPFELVGSSNLPRWNFSFIRRWTLGVWRSTFFG